MSRRKCWRNKASTSGSSSKKSLQARRLARDIQGLVYPLAGYDPTAEEVAALNLKAQEEARNFQAS
jgi:hypothetical protein